MLYDDSCEKGLCSDMLSADAVFMLGAAYIGDRPPGAAIQGEYSGFIGCIQDIKLDQQMLIPKEMIKDPTTAQNIEVGFNNKVQSAISRKKATNNLLPYISSL